MSGKGKRKNRIKPKPHETEFDNKYINLKRFAYDIIKSTALRFHVPESCIDVWDGKPNDYERDDFFSLMCTQICIYQINYRRFYHPCFSQRYEENKLAESKLISGLLYDVIKTATKEFTMSPIDIIYISLSAACELFLFLYSKDMDLNPKKLATNWFDCYLNIYKKDFEAKGGLENIYNKTSRRLCQITDVFLNKFIEDYCLPYNTSANNPDLSAHFYYSLDKFLSQGYREEMKEELKYMKEILAKFPRFEIKTSAPDGATRSNLPESTATPLDQDSQFCYSFAEAYQDLPVTSPEGPPRFHRILSVEERKKIIRSKIRQFGLDSSWTKQSSDQKPRVSTATGPAQSYELQAAKPEDRVQNTGSSDLQTESFKLGIRQSTLDSLGRQSSKQKPSVSTATDSAQSYEHQATKPKDRVQNTGSSDLKTEPFKLRIRQLIGLLRKELCDQKGSTATGPAQSYEHQGAKPKDRVQNTGSSDLQTEPFQQGIRQLIDLLRKELSDQKGSTATGPAQSYEHQAAKPKDRVQNTGSSDLQTGESSGTNPVVESSAGGKIVE